ncbi:tetratricopeptide repeat protein [bacterium]|nr:tetratricopeptide repeat protein [bacterium]
MTQEDVSENTQKNPESEMSAATETIEKAPRPPELYDNELAFYRATLSENLEEGLERYGFALFHSLPPEDRYIHMEKLKLPMNEAADHYNLGNARAIREEYDKAVKAWQKALEIDPSLKEACFNIALALEKLGKKSEARKRYQTYLENVEDPAEKQRIEEHLAEL